MTTDQSAEIDYSYIRLVDPAYGHSPTFWKQTRSAAPWVAAVMLFHFTWLALLWSLAFIADELDGYLREIAAVAYLPLLVVLSLHFGGRFRALNDRPRPGGVVIWAASSGFLLVALGGVAAEQIKPAIKTDHGVIPFAAFLAWLALYAAVLKLPWDRGTELAKKRHLSWSASVRHVASRLRASISAARARQEEDRRSLAAETAQTQAKWLLEYPSWKPPRHHT